MTQVRDIPEREDDPTIDENVGEIDPIAELRDMDAAEDQQEIEAIIGALQGEDRAEPQPETVGDEQAAPQQVAPSQEETDNGKRPGFDKLIRDIETNLGSEHAEVARLMQQDGSRRVTEARGLQDELRSTLLDVKELQHELSTLKGGQPEAPAQPQEQREPQLIDSVQPQQLELFKQMAEHLGYVKQGDLEEAARAESQSDFIQDSIDKGINEWGESFGTRDDDGDFVPSDEVKPLLDAEYERVMDDNRGLTLKDLFVLANHEKIVEAARQTDLGAEPAGSATGGNTYANNASRTPERREAARRASNQANANGSMRTTPNIYSQGDRLEDVVARAALLSTRDI